MTEPMGERGRQGAAPLGGHTPGPWTVPRDGEGRIYGGNGEVLFHVEDYGGEYREADARLIAAAPELLEALSAALAAVDSCCSCLSFGDEKKAIAKRADAAIAKARGEQ